MKHQAPIGVHYRGGDRKISPANGHPDAHKHTITSITLIGMAYVERTLRNCRTNPEQNTYIEQQIFHNAIHLCFRQFRNGVLRRLSQLLSSVASLLFTHDESQRAEFSSELLVLLMRLLLLLRPLLTSIKLYKCFNKLPSLLSVFLLFERFQWVSPSR